MHILEDRRKRICLVIFFIGLILSFLFTGYVYHQMAESKKAMAREIGYGRLEWLNNSINRYVSSTQAIENMVVNSKEDRADMYVVLRQFMNLNPSARSIQVIPEKGDPFIFTPYNDAVSFTSIYTGPLGDAARYAREKSMIAIRTGVDLGNGRKGMAVIHPVYTSHQNEQDSFWGFVLILANEQSLVHGADISDRGQHRMDYGLIRTESSEKEYLVESEGNYKTDSISISRVIYGDLWTIYLHPEDGWVNHLAILVILWSCFLTTAAFTAVAYRNMKIRSRGERDSLTGVYNRTGGDEAVKKYLGDHPGGTGGYYGFGYR